jgi:hypothetical protein
MATVDKNFRIKNGLVIEGSTATLNGNNILSENTQAGDSYILNLVGGATLVKSVGTNLSVDGAGLLSLDLVGIVEDIAGTRLTTDGSTLNVDVDGIADDLTGSYDFATNSDVSMAVGSAVTNLQAYADQAELDAVATANSYTDGEITTALTAAQGYANTAYSDAVSAASSDATDKANAAQAAAELTASNALTTAVNNLEAYADQAEVDAKAYTDTRETAITTAYQSYADTAEQDAKDYADDLINDASSSSAEVWSAYKTSTEIGLAQAAAEQHADDAVAALVGSAPELLDTIQELATALENNPDIIADLQDVAAGKQDTLTAGSNIDITGSTISVTGLDTNYVPEGGGVSPNLYFTNQRALDATSAAYDAAGSASAAQTAAQSYADGLAVNYDPAGSAAAAELYADTADGVILGNLVNGITQFAKVNISDVSAQVAATSTNVTGTAAPIFGFAGETYRSAKLIVKIDNGTHSQISEFLMALDAANNIAVTEYAIVTTNGALADVNFSRKDSNGTIEIKIDVLNDYTVNTNVFGTLIK